MKNLGKCTICKNLLNKVETKENRTEHFACRQVKLLSENYQNIAETRRNVAIKQMIRFPDVMRNLFRL